MTTQKTQVKGQAAVFVGVGKPLEVREQPLSRPQRGNVILALELSGVCGTDLHIVEGRLPVPPPFIPGHEFIGTVLALGVGVARDGLGTRLRVGDRAIACVALPCGKCFNCRRGETASCLKFGVTNFKDPALAPHFHGGYADYLHQPARTLVRIPAGLPLDAVAAFPCAGPTTIRACDFAGNLKRGELVVVQGLGPVGLFAVAWAVKAGCTVVAIGSGRSPARLRLAKRLGARQVIDYRRMPAAARQELIRRLAAKLRGSDGADVVIEASGAPAAIPEGLNLVRTLGRYIVPGQYSQSGGIEIQPQLITFKAIKIIGSGQYKLGDIAVYLKFLARHADVRRLFAASITHRYPVSAVNRALADVSAGRPIKAVFVPSC